MKLIKEYDIEGYNIRIKGKYISKELDDDKVFSSERTDSVRLVAYIKKGKNGTETLLKTVEPNIFYRKKRMWSRKEYFTFRESYDAYLQELEENVKEWIAIKEKENRVQEFDRKMTNGLPDSLNGLK